MNLVPAPIGVSYSTETDVSSCNIVMIDIRWSGNYYTNSIELQTLRDGAAGWEKVDIANGSLIRMENTTGDHQIILTPNPLKKIRLKYTSQHGGETLTAIITGKGV
jgi:hypothetical protein